MTKKNEGKRSNGRSKNKGRVRAKKENFKLSDRTRLALRWLKAHERRTNNTQLLEELIESRADEVCEQRKIKRHWSTLFSHDAGITTLNLFGLPTYTPTVPERSLHRFVVTHAPFFYADDEQTQPSMQRAAILWPRVQEYLAQWERERAGDQWCAAKAMAAELKKHGEPVPKGGGRW